MSSSLRRVIALSLAATVTSCSSSASPAPSPPATNNPPSTAPVASNYPGTIENCGRTYTYTQAPTRALAGWPKTVETLDALGVGSTLIGYLAGKFGPPPQGISVKALSTVHYRQPIHNATRAPRRLTRQRQPPASRRHPEQRSGVLSLRSSRRDDHRFDHSPGHDHHPHRTQRSSPADTRSACWKAFEHWHIRCSRDATKLCPRGDLRTNHPHRSRRRHMTRPTGDPSRRQSSCGSADAGRLSSR
jgi:hypothetical protein